MTKIDHYVSGIHACSNDEKCIVVVFTEINPPSKMAEYIAEAITSWKHEGLPGEPPKRALDMIRQDRFPHNDFKMHFSFADFSNRKLRINDQVVIDMPLQLSDVVTKETDSLI